MLGDYTGQGCGVRARGSSALSSEEAGVRSRKSPAHPSSAWRPWPRDFPSLSLSFLDSGRGNTPRRVVKMGVSMSVRREGLHTSKKVVRSHIRKIDPRPTGHRDLGCLTAGTKMGKTVPLPSSSQSANTPGPARTRPVGWVLGVLSEVVPVLGERRVCRRRASNEDKRGERHTGQGAGWHKTVTGGSGEASQR